MVVVKYHETDHILKGCGWHQWAITKQVSEVVHALANLTLFCTDHRLSQYTERESQQEVKYWNNFTT